jgi:hypothetical protein
MKQCAMTACKRTTEKRSKYCSRHAMLCVLPGCEKHVRTMNMCNTHYNHYLRKRKRHDRATLCFMPHCYLLSEEEGFCAEHARERRDYRKPVKCTVPDCGCWSVEYGFCLEHFTHYKQTGNPVKGILLCGIPECNQPHSMKGMCRIHYARYKRTWQKFQEEWKHGEKTDTQ